MTISDKEVEDIGFIENPQEFIVEYKEPSNEKNKRKEEIVYKYSNNGKGALREAVIIGGKPHFLKYLIQEDGTDSFQSPQYIQEETRRLLPPYIEAYPYDPYTFNDTEELDHYLQRAKQETIDTLYRKIKHYVRLFNDIDEKTLNLLSADILATYFQDRFSTVHYIIIVGDNGTGKSAIADTFATLGYRTVVMTNPTKAIWYRVLGYIEYGQVTIIADESEGIENDVEIMSILKDGYQTKHKIPRMDSDNKKPEWYFPFGIKMIICENSPTEYKAKGLTDRSFKIKTYKGLPQYDIKEIRNPQGNKLRQRLLDEIEDLRKLLLIFKLYHNKPLPELYIGLDGRDKELCKPLIQLFYGTDSQKEIEETLQDFIDIKNERKQQTLEAVMIPLIINAISVNGNKMSNRELFELVTGSMDGKPDQSNENLFYADDFGKIYINTVTKIATDKLGADRKHGAKSHSILLFNVGTLSRNAKIYGVQNRINTKLVDDDAVTHPDALAGTASSLNVLENLELKRNNDKSAENTHKNRNKTDDSNIEEMTHDYPDASNCVTASVEYPPECYRCEFKPENKDEYDNHCCKEHPGKSGYPNKASIEAYNLEPQAMDWEV